MGRAIITLNDVIDAPIAQGLGGWWFGARGDIPAPWETADGQVSTFDGTYTKPNWLGRFAKGVAAIGDAPGTTGGATTHVHTVPSHNHSHTGSSGCSGTATSDYNTTFSVCGHVHSVNSLTDTLQAANNVPAHLTAIPVVYCGKGNPTRGRLRARDFMASALLDQKLVLMWGGASNAVPAGFAKCDGAVANNITTPSLLGKYLRGIATAATEPGSTGGTLTHSHDASHTHVTTTTWPMGIDTACGSREARHDHSHTLNSTTVQSSADNHEPPNITVHFVCFVGHGTAGAAADARATVRDSDLAPTLRVPRGLGLSWAHSLAEIPTGWSHSDGGAWTNGAPAGYGVNKPDTRSRFVLHVPDVNTDGGATGGSDTHTHLAAGHVHRLAVPPYSTWVNAGNCGYGPVSRDHWHDTTPGAYPNIGTIDHKPPHMSVAFLIRD